MSASERERESERARERESERARGPSEHTEKEMNGLLKENDGKKCITEKSREKEVSLSEKPPKKTLPGPPGADVGHGDAVHGQALASPRDAETAETKTIQKKGIHGILKKRCH